MLNPLFFAFILLQTRCFCPCNHCISCPVMLYHAMKHQGITEAELRQSLASATARLTAMTSAVSGRI